MRNAYQGTLFEFMQSDEWHTKILSINWIVEGNFKIYMYEEAEIFIQRFPSILKKYVPEKFKFTCNNSLLIEFQPRTSQSIR